ncbi:MAG: TetR/AcrR family transcriptional regulator, partial [Bacteroidota bacterium]
SPNLFLMYRFPKKEELIEQIYQLFQEELAQITKDYEVLSDFGEMNLQLRDFYNFQQRFRFFYLDLLEIERAFPSIAQKHHAHIEGQINGLEKSFIYNVGLNYLKKYDSPQIYRHLARQFWMCTVFWLMQLAVRGKEGTIDEMTESAWMLVYPHTTSQGKTDFREIFFVN